MKLTTLSVFDPGSKRAYTDGDSVLPNYTHHPIKRTTFARGYTFRYLLLSLIVLICFLLSNSDILKLSSNVLVWNNKKSPFLIHSESGNPAYLIEARHGAVASENHRCSVIGVDILKRGGNAVDAAIGATFCVGVLNMFSSGIGGGGLMTVRIPPTSPGANSSVYVVDFRETAPALATPTMFHDNPISGTFGALSIGVPGEVLGMEEAHKRWGKMPWNELVQPSVELAKGWEVGAELARQIPLLDILMTLRDPDWYRIFAPRGLPLRKGQRIKRTNYSRTLARIASGGSKAFYEGPISDSLLRKIHIRGGILTKDDFLNYTVKVQPALEGTYRGRKVYTTHPPTSGAVLLHMLNLMEHFDLGAEGMTPLNTHRIVEAMKFGFAARTRISDPAFRNDTSSMNNISTRAFADEIYLRLTDDRTHPVKYYNPEFSSKEDHGTSHLSAVDKDGMAVALTSTINLEFGSQILDPETGIILNDEMADFSIPGIPDLYGLWPSPYNFPEPGKRPLSSMTPTIMEYEDGSFYLCIGGAGGSRIFPSMFQVILNLDWGLDASQAVELARVHDQLRPDYVMTETWYPMKLLLGLATRGHKVIAEPPQTAIQVVLSENGKLFAASDSRKNGIAAGY